MSEPRPPAGSGLLHRISEQIRAAGPMTFAEFMEMALYDPVDGFYARPRIGERADFVTAPHVSPAFGALLARQVAEFWALLGRPERFDVIEVGAGDGTLARQILETLPPEPKGSVRYVAAERSERGRRSLESIAAQVVPDLDAIPPARVGCIIANELLDNLPFHRLRGTARGTVELLVGLEGDRLVLVEGAVSDPALLELGPPLRPGEEATASPEAVRFLEGGRAALGRGYILLIDYAAVPGRPGGPAGAQVHGYRDHRVEADVLRDPGSTDITTGVDFAMLARRAEAMGWRVFGPATQRAALISLGFRELDREALARQVEALDARRGVEALRSYSDRNRANLLVSPEGLGGFTWLCLGVDADATPTCMRPAPAPMEPPS